MDRICLMQKDSLVYPNLEMLLHLKIRSCENGYPCNQRKIRMYKMFYQKVEIYTNIFLHFSTVIKSNSLKYLSFVKHPVICNPAPSNFRYLML